MDGKTAIDVTAGIDKDTLNSIAAFGGDYLKYLWWKEVIAPTIAWVVFLGLVAAGVYFIYGGCRRENEKNKK